MGQLQSIAAQNDGAIAERSETALGFEPKGERAISQLVAWSIVCALQKYLVTYSDFRRLGSGALALWRPTGE